MQLRLRLVHLRRVCHAPCADKLKLLLPKLAKQKARLLSVLLACRKKAAALGALAPCSALDLLCNPSQWDRCQGCRGVDPIPEQGFREVG